MVELIILGGFYQLYMMELVIPQGFLIRSLLAHNIYMVELIILGGF